MTWTIFIVWISAFVIGFAIARARRLDVGSPEGEVIEAHSGAIDGEHLRLMLRTKSRVVFVKIPREMVYQMSDDLLRAAALLGKRTSLQRKHDLGEGGRFERDDS